MGDGYGVVPIPTLYYYNERSIYLTKAEQLKTLILELSLIFHCKIKIETSKIKYRIINRTFEYCPIIYS